MQVFYSSTRGGEKGVPSSRAILNGLAGDGGLYVPDSFPALEVSFDDLARMDYRDLAYEVMKLFLTDFTEEELRSCINHAYDSKFDVPEIAPLRKADSAYFLELFHGKTIAFKDMALSILPYLMTTAARKNKISNRICILTATSGDTGKAAMAGFADVPGTEIIVFFPKDGVSPVQKRQMVTQKGKNTHVVAITGNFDDAQTGVKKMFGDRQLAEDASAKEIQFSSANSINVGRLVPQAAYYVYAYAQLIRSGAIKAGDSINITVPTGNFGNILAAYYAKQIGLPVKKLICASNQNNVLTDFFHTGIYDRNRPFILTTSPSMDILVSSNLERLIYQSCGRDAEKTAAFMKQLRETGRYEITDKMKAELGDFVAEFSSEDEVAAAIRKVYEDEHYVIDPHTAVAASVYFRYREESGDETPTVIASTASPYKFARAVLHAIDAGKFDSMTDEEQFDALHEVSGVKIPNAIEEIRTAPVRHKTVSSVEDMQKTVREMLGI